MEVIYAKETLGAGDAGYGLLLASWGAGMVLGSVVFATSRGASLPYLLFFSTLTVGAGYAGMGIAPTLAVACVAAGIGGAGNGVQWVAMVSAVQELTRPNMQARVMSVLESTGAAMPGIGFLLGGGITAVLSPRAAFIAAACGIFATLGISSLLLGRRWDGGGVARTNADERTMVELIPVGPGRREQEHPIESRPEVDR